jgi:hypothetical protein
MVLIILLVAAMVCAGIVRSLALAQRQLRTDLAQQQARWLAASAAERAVWQLTRDPNYTGETWNLDPAQIAGRYQASVTISVPQVADNAAVRHVHVLARLASTRNTVAQFTNQITISLPETRGVP